MRSTRVLVRGAGMAAGTYGGAMLDGDRAFCRCATDEGLCHLQPSIRLREQRMGRNVLCVPNKLLVPEFKHHERNRKGAEPAI